MTRTRTVGVVLMLLLGVALLDADHRSHLKSVEIRTGQIVTETVDLTNGNPHLQIPIPATRQKPTAPRSGH